MRNIKQAVLAVSVTSVVFGASAYAATEYDMELTQQITVGSLSTDVRDGSNAVVSSPSFAMSSVVASTSSQTSTGVLGTSSQRLAVDNPGGANGGWTLSLNADDPGVTKWTATGGASYSYNGTAATGQLTVNPAVGTITPTTGTATNISKGTSASFSGTGAITLMTAAAASEDVWAGYITDIGLSQAIPAGQAVGAYTIDMTQTVAAS